MDIMVYHGGFHNDMPVAEASSLGLEIRKKVGRLSIGNIENWNNLKRLGSSHFVFEFLGSSKINEPLPPSVKSKIEGTFCARFKLINSDIEREDFKRRILERIDPAIEDVDLDNPNTSMHFFLKDNIVYSGKLLYEFDASSFNERRPSNRPFSPPVTLQPREARTWVNLSGIRPGERLLDPFCGSGSILLEAGLMGSRIYGSDVDGRMLKGCKRNLENFGLDSVLKKSNIDVADEKWDRKFDAIVTDPPYGSSSFYTGGDIIEVYQTLLQKIPELYRGDRKIVIGAPSTVNFKELLKISDTELKICDVFREKIHKSLERKVFVLRG